MLLRHEIPSDGPAIRALVAAAFRDAPHAAGTEAAIVDALRADGTLALSLVAVEPDGRNGQEPVGHLAVSPVTVAGREAGWYGLGPLAVRHDRRCRSIGGALVRAGLAALRARGVGGCVVLGDPAYYGRFGFAPDPAVFLAGVPAAYVQVLPLRGDRPTGEVRYHPAFAT